MARRRRWLLPVAGALLVMAVVALVLRWTGPSSPSVGCTVTVDGSSYSLDLAQAANAATISAVGSAEGLSDHAVTIALATAFQESKLHNLPYGDRDSLGLFQQRPSQGWGSPAQVRDPYYATNAFYDALAPALFAA